MKESMKERKVRLPQHEKPIDNPAQLETLPVLHFPSARPNPLWYGCYEPDAGSANPKRKF